MLFQYFESNFFSFFQGIEVNIDNKTERSVLSATKYYKTFNKLKILQNAKIILKMRVKLDKNVKPSKNAKFRKIRRQWA